MSPAGRAQQMWRATYRWNSASEDRRQTIARTLLLLVLGAFLLIAVLGVLVAMFDTLLS